MCILLWVVLIVCSMPLLVSASDSSAQPTSPIEMVPGQRQLFLDDHVVQERVGLKQVMHQPVKQGAVVKPDIPSDGSLIQIRSSPMWDSLIGAYKLIYIAYTYNDLRQMGMAMAISEDGRNWRKPDLGQGIEVSGTTKNNRIQVDSALGWPANCLEATVIDLHDPDPSQRFKGLVGVIPRVPVVSADGIKWRRIESPSIPSGDEASLTYDDAQCRFIACVKGSNEFGRAFNVTFSEDFATWTPPKYLFGADKRDQESTPSLIRNRLSDPGLAHPHYVDPDPATGWKPPVDQQHIPTWRTECYYITVFPYEGLYIGLPTMYIATGQSLPDRRNTDGFDAIQLTMSRDLEHWHRLGDRKEFISPSRIDAGRVGIWDRSQMFATNPILIGDELWFYYSGLKWRENPYVRNADGTERDPSTLTAEEQADLQEGAGAICLAVLRRDGFVSLDAGKEPAYLLTRQMNVKGNELYFNADIREGGSMQFDVLDEHDQVIGGFSRNDLVAINVGGARVRPVWQTGMDWHMLEGRTIRLRIEMVNASLYAFWTEQGTPPAP